MLDSHLTTALVASQAFIAAFKRARAARPDLTGSIINVSSTYGVVSPDQSVYEFRRRGGAEYFKPIGYSVAKSGVLNFTRWLAEYCAPFGVRVNTLVPGGVQEAGHAPEFVAEYSTPNAARPDGARRRIQRGRRVSGVEGVGVHDGRNTRRGRRMDGEVEAG